MRRSKPRFAFFELLGLLAIGLFGWLYGLFCLVVGRPGAEKGSASALHP